MPQTGPDLVSAGYPISRPLLALLGGSTNATQGNVPVRTNLDFPLGILTDVSTASAASGSVNTVAVPVVPGDVFTKVSFLVGATSAASASVLNLWGALYSGTGSAPGTTGAAPVLLGSSASTGGSVNISASSMLTFTLNSPVAITTATAPYGYIYASYSVTIGSASPNVAVSFLCATAASAAQYQYYSTSPYALYMTHNGGTTSTIPGSVGTATRAANPPVVFLT